MRERDMIGIGIDAVEISRIRKVMMKFKGKFSRRVLSPEELAKFEKIQTQSRKVEFLAGRWAIKEAITKSLTNLLGRERYKELKLKMNEVTFSSKDGRVDLPERVKNLGIDVKGSITHTKTLALAIALSLMKKI